MAVQQSDKPFGRALRDILTERDECTTPAGNVNFVEFSKRLPTVHYETIRKAIGRERKVSPHVMEEVAAVLQLDPTHFAEYRFHLAQEEFDVKKVGWEKALANLREFASGWKKKR